MIANPVKDTKKSLLIIAPIALPEMNRRCRRTLLSGAAENKVIGIARAISSTTELEAEIASAPRICQGNKFWVTSPKALTERSIETHYAPLTGIAWINRVIATFWYFYTWLRLQPSKVIFYNFFPEYIFLAIALRLINQPAILDVEDAPRNDEGGMRGHINRLSFKILIPLCSNRYLCASSGISSNLPGKSLVINGIQDFSENVEVRASGEGGPINFLFAGSHEESTGLGIFCDAIKLLSTAHPEYARRCTFYITGRGGEDKFAELVATLPLDSPSIHIKTNSTYDEYLSIARSCHVGLSLKIPNSSIGATTFPSKCIEYSDLGLALISTKVSDVPAIWDQSEAILIDSTHEALTQAILSCVSNPGSTQRRALLSRQTAKRNFSINAVGDKLRGFLYGDL